MGRTTETTGNNSNSKTTTISNKSTTTENGTRIGTTERGILDKENSGLSVQLEPKAIIVDVEGIENETEASIPQPKTKRKYERKATSSSSQSTVDVDGMVQGVFGLLALAVGSEWIITPNESKMLSEPLTRILNKYDLAERIGTASDGFLLLSASAMIVTPRILVTMQKKKEKQPEKIDIFKQQPPAEKEEGKVIEIEQKRQAEETVEQSNRGSKKPNKSSDSAFIKSLSQPVYR